MAEEMPVDRSALTKLLSEMEAHVPGAEDRLVGFVYAELRQQARTHILRGPLPSNSISPTTLVHETYMRLFKNDNRQSANPCDSLAFYRIVSRAMKDILIEEYRRRRAVKRNGGASQVPLSEVDVSCGSDDPIQLADAIARLETIDADAARVVELYHFAGLTHGKIAQILSVAPVTVRRKWQFAQAYLKEQLKN